MAIDIADDALQFRLRLLSCFFFFVRGVAGSTDDLLFFLGVTLSGADLTNSGF